jgi:hypothetical protein
MHLKILRFAFLCGAAVTLSAAITAAQKNKANINPPATPQAKTHQPATHFTQGTITSMEANQMVLTRKVRGKAEQVTFALNSQTQLTGNLVKGARVSVQYRETDHQNVAAAVREMSAETTAKPGKKFIRKKSGRSLRTGIRTGRAS